ncbi:MAG: ATP-binding protein, partial [Succinivibrionaceae bacterium]|nr:ATP-binding protein [Succinivibrionaceae bacterium]
MPEAIGAAAQPGTVVAEAGEMKEEKSVSAGAPASGSSKPAAGLRSIILIHSYLSSRPGAGSQIAAEFRVGEHTQVNGANGSGKTSLLRLIPVFYGMDPGRAVTRSSVKRSFTSYYLPTDRSYIIFEYVTGLGKPALAVLTRSGQNTVNYRFISSSFGQVRDVFIEKTTDPAGTESWQGASREKYTRALTERKVRFTRLLGSIDEYRSVIGNLPGRNSPGAGFLDYSLCANGNRLMHIEKIAQSLITGRVSLENMKRLIADILNSQSSEVSLQVNRAALREVTSDCRGIRAFLGKEKEFRGYAENALRLASLRKSLLTMRSGINAALTAAQGRSASIRAEIDESGRSLAERISALEERRNQAQQALAAKDLERKDTERECQQIEARREEYDRENIEEKRQAVMSIPAMEEELRADRKSFERIANDFDAVGSLIDGRKAEKESAYQKEAARISAERHEAAEKAAAQKSRVLSEKADAERALDESFYKERLELSQKKSALESEIRKNESLLTNPALLADPDALRQKEAAEKAMGDFRDSLGSASRELLGTDEKIRTAEELLRQKDGELAALRGRRGDDVSEMERLRSISDAPENSLLSFLAENVPGWEETIGKTVREDLLLRTDLRPELIPGRADAAPGAGKEEGASELREALPGILIDTSKIESAPAREKDSESRKRELESEIAETDQKIEAVSAEKRAAEESLSKLHLQKSALKEKIEDTGRAEELRKSLADAAERVKESAERKAAEIRGVIRELKAQSNGLGKELEDAEKNHSDELTKLRQAFLERTAAIDAEVSESGAAADEKLRSLSESHKKEMSALESEKKELLGKKGIDDGTVRLWHERISEGERRIAEAEGFRDIVAEYQNWKRDSWSRLDSLRSKLQSITLEAKDLGKDLSSAKAELRSARDERSKSEQALSSRLRESDALASRLMLIRNSFDSRAAELPAAPIQEGEPQPDATGLADSAEKALREYERLKENLISDTDTVRSFVSGSSCPWEELRRGIAGLTSRKEQSDEMRELFPGFDISEA